MKRKPKNEIQEILKNVSKEKKQIAKSILDELIFMKETLEKLKENIKKNGTEEIFQNGRQEINHETPALNSYIKLVARYGSLYRQLCNLLDEQPNENSELDEFLKNE